MEVNPGTREERAIFQPKFEAFLCRYPWGALAVATSVSDSSIPIVTQRLEAVLSFWEQLDTLQYLRVRKYTLGEQMLFYYESTLRMWVDTWSGKSIRDLLHEVIERMRHASEDEIQMRVWRRMYQVIDTEPTLKHREWLKSRDLLEAAIAHDQAHWPERYEDFKTGKSQAGFLTDLDAKYPGA